MPTIGFLFLFLAISAAFFQISFYAISSISKNYFLLKTQKVFTFLTAIFCSLSMLCLIYSFIVSDFSVQNVYSNSHQLKPLIYKISGSWGNHEGSMLLLVTILTLYSSAFAIFSNINNKDKDLVLTIQSCITFGFLAFIIFTSNPFLRIFPVPDAGIGLNPILQDIGLAMHPPMLYTGYIGFSIIFSLSIAALLKEKIDKNFAKFMRPWLTFSWSFLTLGIGLGSWWAYRELGWGGYWFWDAVENVSLMPWLCATALLHVVIILEKTGNFKIWSSFLGILTFVFCLLGIFLVRSGILTSVHSFANDPSRGIFIIILFLIIGGLGFAIFFIKSLKIKTRNSHFDIFSRSGFILINNFIFCLVLFVVVLGTLYPIILQLFFSRSISVGAPYYIKLLSPIVVIILSLMIFIPALKLQHFKKFNQETIKKLIFSVISSMVLFIFLFSVQFKIIPFLVVLLALMLIFFAIFNLKKVSQKKIKEIFSYYSMFLAHVGFAIIILAISLNYLFSKTIQLNMYVKEEVKISSYKIKFNGIDNNFGKNYLVRVGIFEVESGNDIFNLKPESRYYPVSDQNTSEAAIKHNLFSDLYIVLGDKNKEDNFAVRIYYRPFISFIWFGCFMMFGGGMLFLVKLKLPTRNIL